MRIILKNLKVGGITLLMLLAACSNLSRMDESGSSLHISFPSSVVGLDPVKDFPFHSSAAIMKMIYPPLYRGPEDPLNILELVETSDYRTYTLKVKKGLRFQNDPCFPDGQGPALTAKNIKGALERTGSKSSHESPVEEKMNLVRDIEIINSHTLILTLNKPDRWFSEIFSSPQIGVIPQDALECYGDNIRFHPVGSGPYRLATWDEQKLILIRNENFRPKDISKLKKIHLIFSKDKLVAYNEFRKENLDIIPLPPSLAEKIVRFDPASQNFKIQQADLHPDIEIFSGQNPQLIYCTLYSITNSRVRRAVNYAVDRNQIRGARTDLIPASGPLFDFKSPGFHYNLPRALALLKQAGFPEGSGLKDTYYLHTAPGGGSIAEKISENLHKIGINVSVVNTSWVGYQQMSKKDMDIARFASLGTDSFGQLNVYQRPTFMKLNSRIHELTQHLEADRYNRDLIKKVTNEIMNDPPLLYLFWTKNIYLAHKGFFGIDPDWFGLSPFLDIKR